MTTDQAKAYLRAEAEKYRGSLYGQLMVEVLDEGHADHGRAEGWRLTLMHDLTEEGRIALTRIRVGHTMKGGTTR